VPVPPACASNIFSAATIGMLGEQKQNKAESLFKPLCLDNIYEFSGSIDCQNPQSQVLAFDPVVDKPDQVARLKNGQVSHDD
jgi:hypothetical protein